uniref:Uncharacterized protein n=1 Tax=Molossus molossus TaxID=27622 RepID=A0A7J8HZP4_MOLMO|nr:hypothetical protein HJG59_010762 [Molossus molossus]
MVFIPFFSSISRASIGLGKEAKRICLPRDGENPPGKYGLGCWAHPLSRELEGTCAPKHRSVLVLRCYCRGWAPGRFHCSASLPSTRSDEAHPTPRLLGSCGPRRPETRSSVPFGCKALATRRRG